MTNGFNNNALGRTRSSCVRDNSAQYIYNAIHVNSSHHAFWIESRKTNQIKWKLQQKNVLQDLPCFLSRFFPRLLGWFVGQSEFNVIDES